MSWSRNLCFYGVAIAIVPTVSIAQERTITVHPEPKFVIDGLAVGAPVAPNSKAYRQYVCKPSEQYDQFTRCHESHTERDVQISRTIMHTSNLITWYVNKELSPAYFTVSAIDTELNRLSGSFNTPRIYRLNELHGFPKAIIATFGGVELQPLSPNDLAILAEGKSPHLGILVDFLNDFHRSASLNLPVYKLVGGKGFAWIANYDQQGKGNLRFFAADPSQMERQVPQPQEPPQAHPQVPPQAPPKDLSEARERLQDADRQMTLIDQKLLSPEQAERYRSLRRQIDKLSPDALQETVSNLAAKAEKFTKQIEPAVAVAKEIQACKALKEKLASEDSSGIPPAISQNRDDAILRFSALKVSSTLDEIKSIRAALENAQRGIADFKDFLEFRRLADQKIARIETETGFLFELDDEIRKGLEQRISDAKRALKSENFADSKQSFTELIDFYEAHPELRGNKFEPN